MQNLIKALKALSDETRLRILNLLLERECCVCEVMQALDISQSRASRNLGILQEAGFLKARRDRTWILYSVDREAANRYAASLTNLVPDFLASEEDRVKGQKVGMRADDITWIEEATKSLELEPIKLKFLEEVAVA